VPPGAKSTVSFDWSLVEERLRDALLRLAIDRCRDSQNYF
jgi:hypothetical protein